MRWFPAAAVILLPVAAIPAFGALGGEECLPCHREKTPAIVASWTTSAHGREGVGCSRCHGKGYAENHPSGPRRAAVTASLCGECHGKETGEHLASRHGLSFRAGRACTRNERRSPEVLAGCVDCHEKGSSEPRQKVECARFLAQSPEMQRQGCLACHGVESRCDSCHTSHDTDLAVVRDPAVCAPCHMGPDHPQYEMWKTSRHGILAAAKGNSYAPDCAACHMPDGTHNVSRGITMGLAGQEYETSIRDRERGNMLAVCTKCHTEAFSRRNLGDGDAVQKQAKALVDEAESIVEELGREGLLFPPPDARPPHPLSGAALVLGPQMLYENLSRPEALFFRMKKFYYVITYKGVYHQNPDYAHWYGNAPLKLALSELRSEAETLRRLRRLEERLDNLAALRSPSEGDGPRAALKKELRALREKFLGGALSREEFDRRRNALLDAGGL